MQDLDTLGGSWIEANGINDSGQIVGQNGFGHAALYSGGIMEDLGTLGGSWSVATAINASGQVVGYGPTVSDTVHAFLYSSGIMTDLGTLGGGMSLPLGINASGQVVGVSWTPEGAQYPVLYSGGRMTDLNSLLPAGSGWWLHSDQAINDSGQIVGSGYINGRMHAYLLDPSQNISPPPSTPEPGSLALLSAGLVALGLRRWLRPGKLR
jgi:probable HAF family extracellular repeat protein